jgi:UDP-GlcNAc3NAcA epimerase
MIALEQNASLIITDSGGVQKEAFFFGKPCLILRSETEWTEIIETGSAKLVDAEEEKIVSESIEYLKNPPSYFPSLFGDGKAANFICEKLLVNKLY